MGDQTDPRDLAAAIAEALYIEPSTDSETARQHALMQAAHRAHAVMAVVEPVRREAGAAVGEAGALRARVLELTIREAARDKRIAELDAEVSRLRTRQEYATEDWCRPAGLDELLDAFERDHRPWPPVPDVRIDPIPGHVRHIILLLAHAITRVTLEQADLQMRLDAQARLEAQEEEATGAGQ